MAKNKRTKNGQGTIRQLANGKYQCSIETKDALGKRLIKTATADDERTAREKAQKKVEQYIASIAEDNPYNAKLAKEPFEKVMMGKWFDEYTKNKWTSTTKKSRKNDLAIIMKELGEVRLDSITTNMLNNFFSKALTPTNRKRLGMVYSITEDFFKDMYNNGVLLDSPFGRGIKKLPSVEKVQNKEYTLENIDEADFDEEDVRFFTDEEVIKIMDALTFIDMNGNPLYPRAPIYNVMLLTGLRGQEIRALNVKDIDFEKHTIRINKALATTSDEEGREKMALKRPKTSSSIRTIGINEEVEKILKRIIKERPNKDCPILYCTKTGNWVGKDNFARDFRKLLQKLDIPQNGRGPHCLRHTFASLALENNDLSPLKHKSPLFISAYLGHKDLSITYRIYTHLDKSKLQDISNDEPDNALLIEYQ